MTGSCALDDMRFVMQADKVIMPDHNLNRRCQE